VCTRCADAMPFDPRPALRGHGQHRFGEKLLSDVASAGAKSAETGEAPGAPRWSRQRMATPGPRAIFLHGDHSLDSQPHDLVIPSGDWLRGHRHIRDGRNPRATLDCHPVVAPRREVRLTGHRSELIENDPRMAGMGIVNLTRGYDTRRKTQPVLMGDQQ
jgi:hypothetical protein